MNQRMKIGLVLLVVMLLGQGVILPLCKAAEHSVEVTGAGPTEEDALQDAKRLAVEEGVGALITSESVMVDFKLESDVVKTIAQGFLKEFTIVSKEPAGNLFRVKIRGTVADLVGDIAWKLLEMPALYESVNKPRVMVLIKEKNQGKAIDEHPVETAMIKELIDRGFKVVDQEQVNKVRENEQARQAVLGDEKAAKALATMTGAELLLVGSADSKPFMDVEGELKSDHARVQLKVLWSDTGEVIVADQIEKVPGVGGTDDEAGLSALSKAGKAILDRDKAHFVGRIFGHWIDVVNQGRHITLVASNAVYGDVTAFKTLLKSYPKFVSFNRDEFSAGVVKVQAVIKGKLESLTDYLSEKKVKNKTVNITGWTANTVDVNLTK